QRIGDWHDLADLRRRFRDGVAQQVPLLSPFVLLSQPSTRAEQRRCAEAWSARVAPPAAVGGTMMLKSGRLRIGYLSADFRTHATAFLADAIDILVDLKGHTENAPPTLLAMRPAPIQVHYLGYPGTLGGNLADYLIGDAVVTPPEDAGDYAETLALLPGSYQINDRERPIAPTPSRAELDLPRSGVVLCCFNSGYKFNPEVFDAWMRILAQVPEAVLWLLARRGD